MRWRKLYDFPSYGLRRIALGARSASVVPPLRAEPHGIKRVLENHIQTFLQPHRSLFPAHELHHILGSVGCFRVPKKKPPARLEKSGDVLDVVHEIIQEDLEEVQNGKRFGDLEFRQFCEESDVLQAFQICFQKPNQIAHLAPYTVEVFDVLLSLQISGVLFQLVKSQPSLTLAPRGGGGTSPLRSNRLRHQACTRLKWR